MGTKITPYTKPENVAKKQQVEKMFDSIAHKYDFLNHLFTLGIDVLWRKRCIRLLRKKQPSTILDVATGTGDFAIEAIRMGLDAQVTGLDLSAGMLENGKEKIKKRRYEDKIEMIQGDSENLPFDDNSFNAYTVGFGVRNFENLDKGLREMHRVLKPNGTTVILELSKPKIFPIKQLFWIYFTFIMPTIGRIVSKDSAAYTYLPASVAAFPEGKEFLEKMEQAGFKELKQISLTGGIASIYTGNKD